MTGWAPPARRCAAVAVLMACGLGLACGGDATHPEDPPPPGPGVVLLDSAQWGGGEVRLLSAGFATALPTVTAGSESLAVRLVAGDTVGVHLPSGPAGPMLLTVTAGAETLGTPRIALAGVSASDVVPSFGGYLMTRTIQGRPFVIGAAPGYVATFGRGVQLLDGRSGELLLDTTVFTNGFYAPGLSVTTGELFLRDTSRAGVFAYTMTPLPTRGAKARADGTRHVYQLADSVWMVTGSHSSWVGIYAGGTNASTYFYYDMESPWYAAAAPSAHRIVLTHNGSFTGTPVIDTQTGDTAFQLPFLRDVKGAAFSPNEQVLHLVGRVVPGGDSVVSVRSSDGAPIASAPVPPGLFPDWITVEPDGSRIYVTAYANLSPSNPIETHVLVYRLPALELIGHLDVRRLPSPCVSAGSSFASAAVIDATLRKLYVVNSGAPVACRETFDLSPVAP